MVHRQRFYLLFAALALVLLVAGCGRVQRSAPAGNPGFAIQVAAQPDPPVVGAAQLLVTVKDRDGNPVQGARVRVEGNMAHPGMTPVFADGSGGEAGRYAVPMNWTMGGDWVLDVTVTLPDGQTAHQQFPVRVAG
jgi:hypothetical protein